MTIPMAAVPSTSTPPVASSPDAANAAAADAPSASLPQFSVALALALANAAGMSSPSAKQAGPVPASAPDTDSASEGVHAGDAVLTESESQGDVDISDPGDESIGSPASDDAAAMSSVGIAAHATSPPSTMAPSESRVTSRSLELLAPAFRDRLQRVIDRMETEFGYKVEIVETYRSQSRQDALFARGRTEPGQVVTWTRASNHTRGQAADLVIDGTYTDTVAYERLARVAREEGLRTLGPRDPGHVEWASPRSGAPAAPRSHRAAAHSTAAGNVPRTVIGHAAPSVSSLPSLVTTRGELEPRASSAGAPAVAPVAPVATVARVAQVAEVAQVAIASPTATAGGMTPASRALATRARGPQPSAERRSNESATEGTPVRASGTSVTGAARSFSAIEAIASSARGRTPSDGAREQNAEPNDTPARDGKPVSATASNTATDVLQEVRDSLLQAVTANDPSAAPSSDSREPSAIRSPAHVDMSERIARLLKVQDAAAERPLSQVLLRLERPDGGEDRVRVDLRGTTISATLDVGDQAAADRLGANMQELQRALEQHGFDTETLAVRATSRSAESSTIARAAGAAAEADLQRAAASGSQSHASSRDRGARHDDQRQPSDSHHHRSRRDRKGDR